jgi:hypothetical protein
MATQVKSIERVIGSFSDNPVFDALGHRLAELSAAWGSTKDVELVARYNVVLLSLIELGFNDSLDLDVCLPDELMAAEYRRDGWHLRTATLQLAKEKSL